MMSHYIHLVRRWLWLLVLTTVVAGLLSYALSIRQPVHYTARTKLLVGPAVQSLNPDLNDLRAAAQLMEVYAVLPTMRPFQEQLLAAQGLDLSPGQLEKRITISTDTTTQILTISVLDDDRDRAVLIANAVAEQLVSQSPTAAQNEALQQQLQQQIERIENSIALSEETLRELEVELIRADTEQQRTNVANRIAQERSYKSEAEKLLVSLYTMLQKAPNNLIAVLEPAGHGSPVDRQIPLKTILGALSGLVVGVALTMAAEYANDTIRTPDDLHATTDVPYLGNLLTQAVPHRYGPVVLARADTLVAEDYRQLGMKLRLAGHARPLNRVLVGDVRGDGSSGEVAANLAVVLAQLGDNIILVDADPYRRVVSQIFSLTDRAGLTEWYESDGELSELLVPTAVEGLAVLPAGMQPVDLFALVASPRFAGALNQLDEVVDIIVLAVPALATVAASAVLAARADGTLIAVRAGRDRRHQVREVLANLHALGAPVAGMVLINQTQGLRHRLGWRRTGATLRVSRQKAGPVQRRVTSKTVES